ncbi:MAG: phenylalanine--tRNA ligase subunit beta [Syntrophotaleaceae bacterium]
MIVSYNWLKEFVDFDLPPEELGHRLTMAGLEVDAMEYVGTGLDSVIVARLVEVAPHPDADRLTLCQVDTGSETVPVVCGAQNHRTGDFVALAQVGSVLPGDFKIKKSKIRGQVSMGMLCSEKELGLAEESEGILILPTDLKVGEPVFQALGLKDVRYELGLTPNRPDCLSLAGVAREVSALTGRALHVPVPELVEEGPSIGDLTSVTVEEPGLCPRYAARLIQGVRIGPSPDWLVRRIESVGMRSINNVVDVTNLILMELGQPLHAFDFNLLQEKRIVVKRAEEEQVFVTLDGQSRVLKNSDLVICDGRGAVALAGIMGGENSEIREDTTEILLESAYFNPTTIRRSSKRLGMHTEASHRFERGCDVNMVPLALDKAAELIRQVAGGTIARGAIDIYPRPIVERVITLSTGRTNQVLGLKLKSLEIENILKAIGLDARPAEDRDDEMIYVTVPTARPDLEREIDLIEEVARLNGYDRIPVTMPASRMICHRPPDMQSLVRQVRNAMVAAGFAEVVNYSFVSPSAWNALNLADGDPRRNNVRILNPLSEDQSVMRTTLVSSLLETVSRNIAYRSLDLRLFELRPVYLPVAGEELPEEKLRLTAVVCGRREPEGWAQQRESVDFFDLKGVAEVLFAQFQIQPVIWDGKGSEPFLHPGKSCRVVHQEGMLGTLGEVHPAILETFDIDKPVFLLDFDLSVFSAASGKGEGFRPISRFPDVYRDSAFLLDDAVSASQVFQVMDKARSRFVESYTLFDLYRGEGIAEGKKSLAIRVRYRSPEKTLTEEEIGSAHERIVKLLQNELGAEIR